MLKTFSKISLVGIPASFYSLNGRGIYFLGILFLINTIDSNMTIANSGRVIKAGNSGIVGDVLVVGVVVGEDEVGLDVGLELGDGVGVGLGDGDGVGEGVGVVVGIFVVSVMLYVAWLPAVSLT